MDCFTPLQADDQPDHVIVNIGRKKFGQEGGNRKSGQNICSNLNFSQLKNKSVNCVKLVAMIELGSWQSCGLETGFRSVNIYHEVYSQRQVKQKLIAATTKTLT